MQKFREKPIEEIPYKILIGSKAIAYHFTDYFRTPNDTDYAVDVDMKSCKPMVEWLYNPVLFEHGYGKYDVLPANALYTLKVSHLFWEKGWEKHLDDAVFLQDKGCTLDFNLYKDLRNFWESYLPSVRRSDLKMTKEDFFTNKVNEDVDSHDLLHKELSNIVGQKPAYESILIGEVETCPNLFEALSFEEKVRVVQDEILVMAIERVPKGYPLRLGFQKQLNNCIMKHFPEYIALFAIQNYKTVTIPPDYYLEFGEKYLENKFK